MITVAAIMMMMLTKMILKMIQLTKITRWMFFSETETHRHKAHKHAYDWRHCELASQVNHWPIDPVGIHRGPPDLQQHFDAVALLI